MKFAYPEIGGVFQWNQPQIPTLTIENQRLFRRLLRDISLAIEGMETPAVLSKDNKLIEFSKYAELITDFIRFDINKKTLLNKVCAALERAAVSAENYLQTQKLLAEIENSIGGWAFEFPCDIIAAKLSVQSLLKAVGVEINDDYQGERGDVERIIDYMELVREFDRDKLFITVNLRNYFTDDIVEEFMETALAHEYKVLMIESRAYPLLKTEKRLTIDADLCEF